MPVGTTADFDVTRRQLVRASLRLLGNTDPSNDEESQAVEALNILIRALDARGDHLWTISNTESTLTLIAGQQAYTTGLTANDIQANILKLEYAAVLQTTDREVLTILDKPSSLRTPLQDETNSQPTSVHLARAKLLSGNRMLFYPTPNQSYPVVYKFRRPLYDFDLTTDNPDFPSEFIKPLKSLLAYELCPEYGTPVQERQQLIADGERAWNDATSFNADSPGYEPLRTEYF